MYIDIIGKTEKKVKNFYLEQKKGVRGMPRVSEATKDVISCDKLRGRAHLY